MKERLFAFAREQKLVFLGIIFQPSKFGNYSRVYENLDLHLANPSSAQLRAHLESLPDYAVLGLQLADNEMKILEDAYALYMSWKSFESADTVAPVFASMPSLQHAHFRGWDDTFSWTADRAGGNVVVSESSTEIKESVLFGR